VYSSANPPRFCSSGHRLGPYKVIVSFTHCRCDKVKPGSVGHTTWKCRTCDEKIYADDHADDSGFFH
jgi:hypothetical protein